MPIHIAPHALRPTRRGFLGAAAAAGAGLLFAPGRRARAAEEAAPAPRRPWALLADTHIPAADFERNREFHMAANLVAAAADALREKPVAALVNGDVARTLGAAGDYQAFVSLIAPFRLAGVPLHLTLGNHDDRDNFVRVLAGGEGTFAAPKRASAVDVDGVRWILLDSLDRVNVTPGILGKEQLDWLARTLDAAPRSPTVLFLHHNPEPTDIGLRDTREFLEVVRPRRQVKAAFFGHTHTWRRWEDEGLHLVNLPAVGYAFKAGEPIGWVLARPRTDGLEIELRTIGPAHADTGKKIELRWRSDEPPGRSL